MQSTFSVFALIAGKLTAQLHHWVITDKHNNHNSNKTVATECLLLVSHSAKCFIDLETGSASVTRLQYGGAIIACCNLELLGSADPPDSVSHTAGATDVYRHV